MAIKIDFSKITVYPPGQSGIPEDDEVLKDSITKETDAFLNPTSDSIQKIKQFKKLV